MPDGKRITCTVDGTQFQAVEAVFGMNTRKIQGGKAGMEGFSTSVHVRVNPENKQDISFDTIKKLFDLAKKTGEDRYKPMKVEFWKEGEDKQVLCCYTFTGWISSFRTSNVGSDIGSSAYNHVFDLELTPLITKNDLKISN
jgi:hypothetical protein